MAFFAVAHRAEMENGDARGTMACSLAPSQEGPLPPSPNGLRQRAQSDWGYGKKADALKGSLGDSDA